MWGLTLASLSFRGVGVESAECQSRASATSRTVTARRFFMFLRVYRTRRSIWQALVLECESQFLAHNGQYCVSEEDNCEIKELDETVSSAAAASINYSPRRRITDKTNGCNYDDDDNRRMTRLLCVVAQANNHGIVTEADNRRLDSSFAGVFVLCARVADRVITKLCSKGPWRQL